MTTQVRVGNAEYARSNGSFGLTTLRDRHARFPSRGKVLLQFRGKGGAEHDVPVDDARLARLVRRCQELPGQALFQYVDDEGGRRAIDSGQVNDYLRERMGDEFTAKDFRTWHATLHALTLLDKVPVPEKPQRARAAPLHQRRDQGSGDWLAKYARGVPQVVHQSCGVRRLAERRAAAARRARNPAKALLALLSRAASK